MTKIEALELELAARKMVEGTKLEWWAVIRCARSKNVYDFALAFDSPYRYELALCVIEGKPVWAGDTLYPSRCPKPSKMIIDSSDGANLYGSGCCIAYQFMSWNPPKPKNLSHRERLTANAEDFDNIITEILAENETYRKALERLK